MKRPPRSTFPASIRFAWRDLVTVILANTKGMMALYRAERETAHLWAELADVKVELAGALEELRWAKNRAKNVDAYLANAERLLGIGNFNAAHQAVKQSRAGLVDPLASENQEGN